MLILFKTSETERDILVLYKLNFSNFVASQALYYEVNSNFVSCRKVIDALHLTTLVVF